MRIGFALPHLGPLAAPETIVKAAQRAEALGYHTVWTTERLLAPVDPQTPYPASAGGKLPEQMKRVIDPLTALTFVAAHTKYIDLGTSVLDIPFYNPVVLARQLTAIDVFSNGRLRVGFGLGWSQDEFDATGASRKDRGARAEEFLHVLKAIWTTDPAEFHGQFFTLPKSIIQPKPVQKPHPPIYLAAFDPRALERVARQAHGWNPVMLPVKAMQQTMAAIRQMAASAGRDPAQMEMVVRANVVVTAAPLGKNRGIFCGSWEQIQEDIDAVKSLNPGELFFDPLFDPSVGSIQDFLKMIDRFRTMV